MRETLQSEMDILIAAKHGSVRQKNGAWTVNAVAPQPAQSAAVSHRPVLHVAVVGPAGHGKSALISRLLAEMGCRTDGAETKALHTASHDVLLTDDPDQSELLRDSLAGIAQADAAVLVVDATEHKREPSLLYGHLLKLLGIRQVVVVISKLDRIDYDAGRFREIETAIIHDLKSFGLKPADVIAVSARHGEGLTRQAYTAEWYRPTLLEALDQLSPAHAMRKFDAPAASVHTSSAA
jgi:translation elongation factor EF-1alpha